MTCTNSESHVAVRLLVNKEIETTEVQKQSFYKPHSFLEKTNSSPCLTNLTHIIDLSSPFFPSKMHWGSLNSVADLEAEDWGARLPFLPPLPSLSLLLPPPFFLLPFNYGWKL